MIDREKVTKLIYDRTHKTGEEIKNDLPNWLERVEKDKTWSRATNPKTGEPFASIGEWLIANWPYGPAMGSTKHSITYDELIVLCEHRPTLKDLLIRHRPKSKGGRPKKDDTEKRLDNIKEIPAWKSGTSRLYIEERLQRDHKKIWNDYLTGKYKSARQAALAAGFIKDTHDPVMRIKANWRKCNAKQRREVLAWIKENGS